MKKPAEKRALVTLVVAIMGVLVFAGLTSHTKDTKLLIDDHLKLIPNSTSEEGVLGKELLLSEDYIACFGHVNMSLDGDCAIEVLPEHIGVIVNGGDYSVRLETKDGEVLMGNIVSGQYVGMELKAILTDNISGRTCWAHLLVEDKDPPVIICEEEIVTCLTTSDLPIPDVEDNCDDNPELFLLGTQIVPLTCDQLYNYQIIRRFVAVDESGNQSEECEHIINVSRIVVDLIDFPANLTRDDMTALECNQFDSDENGFPLVSVSGVPSYEGVDIYPYFENLCNIAVTFKDHAIVDPKNCKTKLIRTWKVLEWWCSELIISEHNQIIEISDQIPPEIEPLPDVEITTTPHACEGEYLLPSIVAEDDCNNDNIKVDIDYPGGFISNQNGGVKVKLPFGENRIVYFVYDWCGNLVTDTFYVEVIDETPPVAVCISFSVVSLDENGYAKVPASAFDNGSFDECEIDYFEVRRKDLGAQCEDENQFNGEVFNPYAEFCCADAGTRVVVELQVWDKAGNSNRCWVEIEVQDKIPPVITPPNDMTIFCHEPYDVNDLSIYGEAEVFDVCGFDLVEEVEVLVDQCGVGEIIRTFTASDSNGEAVATQTIYVINPKPFDMDPDNWPLDFESDEFCGDADTDPENLPPGFQFPILDFGACDLVAMTYHDQRFFSSGIDSVCFKILRTWYVVDWCQLDEGGEALKWVYHQTIRIYNSEAPELTGSLDTIVQCAISCEEGLVTLEQSAMDDCTPDSELRWKLDVDLDSDGTIDEQYSGNGHEASVTDGFPIGSHTLIWLFYDRCGNIVTGKQILVINPCISPKAILITGIAVALNPMDTSGDGIIDTEMACIWADEFDASSYHPCGIDYEFSFSPDSIVTELCFDCFSLGLNKVPIYIVDIFGNYDVVIIDVDVQDNNGVDFCMDPRDCIIYPPDTTLMDCIDQFDPAPLGSMPIVDPDCICTDYEITFEDEIVDNYPNESCTFIIRTWRVQFNCGPNPIVGTHIQQINVFNLLPPDLTIPDDITLETSDETCEAEASDLALATSVNSCNSGVIITNSYNGNGPDANDFYPIGVTEVIFTAVDSCGNETMDTLRVTVNDGTPPVCIPQDITVFLDSFGMVVVEASEIDGGSFDLCGVIDSLAISKSAFDCDDIGDNIVTLTVIDDSGNSSECEATITVIDTIAPICEVQDIIVLVDEEGFTFITPEMVDVGSFDPCGDIVGYELSRDSFSCEDSGTIIEIILTLTDNSGNTTDCMVNVTVEDNVAPVCVVLDTIVVIIGESNEVIITPGDVDNGSFDLCGIIVDSLLSKTLFTCDDLGANLVIYTVTDNSGNTSTCELTVIVEDGTMLMCIPMDITIYLDENGMASITPDDVNGGSAGGCFNDIVLTIDKDTFDCDDQGQNMVTLTVTDSNDNESECVAIVTVIDSIPPMLECENITLSCLDFDGDFEGLVGYSVIDNCDGEEVMVNVTVLVDATNECGIGVLTRRITVTDASGNVEICDQIITIEGPEDVFGEANITPPTSEIILTDCQSPGDLGDFGGEPVIDVENVDCADVEVTFSDMLLTAGNACNDTIIRTYTIIDRCQFDGVTMAGMWVYMQTIVIQDLIAPVVVAPADVTLSGTLSTETCEFNFNIAQFSASDNCTPFDELVFTNDSPFADDNNSIDITGDYPPGTYIISVTATDLCGNVGEDSFSLTIPDTMLTLPCGKIFAAITDNQTVTVNVNSIVITTNPCYDYSNLVYSFSNVSSNVPTITFDCDDVFMPGDPGGPHKENPIYAWRGGMIVDECESQVQVTDGNNFCPDGLVAGGVVTNAQGENVEGVKIKVSGDMEVEKTTNANGFFVIDDLEYGANITIEPYKNDDVLNGLSTLDLVRIQRHIMGTEPLAGSYQLIAADVDNNKTISSTDLITLRKVLLGVLDAFPENTSWRMIDRKYQFPDNENLFYEEWPESIELLHFDSPTTVQFTGIKIGDVDYSARVNSRQISTRNTLQSVIFEVVHQDGQLIIRANEDMKATGMQFSLTGISESQVIHSSMEGFSSSNYNINKNGTLHLSWNTSGGNYVHISKGDEIFVIPGLNPGSLKLVQDRLPSEVYILSDEVMITKSIEMNEVLEIHALSILSTSPNPWAEYTDVSFYISYEDHVVMNFYDSNGRFLHQKLIQAVHGRNDVRIDRSDLPATGMILYEVASSKEIQQGKMILLK